MYKKMIGYVKPLIGQMMMAILLGVLGFISAFLLGILGAYGIINLVPSLAVYKDTIPFGNMELSTIVTLLIVAAVMRGILHYAEQFLNHYIAFKILARFRNILFRKMRQLAPAKLEEKNAGNLLSVITSDIEWLEVFFAHTISPIGIAIIVAILLVIFYAFIHPVIALVGFIGYLLIGLVVPIVVAKAGNKTGEVIREEIGSLNGGILDILRGIREIIQFSRREEALGKINNYTSELNVKQDKIRKDFGKLLGFTDTIMLLIIFAMIITVYSLVAKHEINPAGAIIAVVTVMSTFAPFISLANLGSTLTNTNAAAKRVFAVLEETPKVNDITDGENVKFKDLEVKNVSFAYDEEKVLKDVSFKLKKGEILGIAGPSGCGKSTLMKLCMRFFEVDKGEIIYSGVNVNKINTYSLRRMISYVTQSTVFFGGTIKDNLLVAKDDATDEEIKAACKKASILEYIESLPKGFNTRVAELGDNFSGGERQRIGVARAFLSGSDVIFLDEPTSNLDSQNEAVILKALKEEKGDTTLVIVSHRKSTLGICDRVLDLEK